uniref:G_PROTEIN_RECEP_F1_2 domain-containing protein n=1 Tax=Syphacia muris TaxID=451379 RepID=A0A0N5AB83_9BILA
MRYGDVDVSTQLLILFRIFTFFGGFIIISNLIVLLVINTNSELRVKMCLHSFSAVADLVGGISFFMAGHERKLLLFNQHYYVNASPWECMTRRSWPPLYIIGGQLTALTKFALSTEYYIAIRYATLYKVAWSIRHKIILGSASCVLSLMNTGLAFLAAYSSPNSYSTMLCSITRSTGNIFGVFHFILIALSYVLSAIVAFLIYKKMKKLQSGVIETNRHLVTLITMLISIICIVLPMFVILAREYHIITVDDFVSG